MILSNSAGALSSPLVNGMTIEMEACLDYGPCRDALVAQQLGMTLMKASIYFSNDLMICPCQLVSSRPCQSCG